MKNLVKGWTFDDIAWRSGFIMVYKEYMSDWH